MKDGSTITDEINVADAHPAGKRPFGRIEYINKFKMLTNNIITDRESKRFLNAVQNLQNLKSRELQSLNIEVKNKGNLKSVKKAIF